MNAMPEAALTARRIAGNCLGPEEAVSVAYFTLVAVAPRYDPARGIPFWGFARQRVIGALQDEMRKSLVGNWRTGHGGIVAMDDGEGHPVEIPTPPTVNLADAKIRQAAMRLRKRGKRTYIFAQMLAAGWPSTDIQKAMRMSWSLYSQTRDRVLRLMREAMETPELHHQWSKPTLSNAARRKWLTPTCVRTRLWRGVTIDDAFRETPGITIRGVRLSAMQWARLSGMTDAGAIKRRIERGIEPFEALFIPSSKKGGWKQLRGKKAV